MKGTLAEQAERIVEHVLDGSPEAGHVVLSPVVWQQDADRRRWYFTVASGSEFRVDQIVADNRTMAERLRKALVVALTRRKPIVIHDFDDELEMARWCEAIWPCPKTREIRAGIELERRQQATVQ